MRKKILILMLTAVFVLSVAPLAFAAVKAAAPAPAVVKPAAQTTKKTEPAAKKDGRIRMAVLEFKDNSGGDAPGQAIQDMMIGELSKVKEFSVIERAKLENIAQEQRMSAQGLIDDSTAIEMGHVAGAKYLIVGSITQYHYQASAGVIPLGGLGIAVGSEEGHVTIDMRLIDSKTSEVVKTIRESGVANQSQGGLVTLYGGFATGKAGGLLAAATNKCVIRMVHDLREQLLGDKGVSAVLNSQGKEIMCNMGTENGGVNVGDILVSYRQGEVVKDLDGKVLDVKRNYLCAFKITEANPNHSKGTLVKGCLPRRGAPVTFAPDGWKKLTYAKEDDAPEADFDIDAKIKEMKQEENNKNQGE